MLPAVFLLLAQITDYGSLPRTNPHQAPADVTRGQRTFMGQCAGCHGPRGEGAKGPPLNRGSFEHAQTDFELFRVIRAGIPGTEMPSGVQVSDKEIWQTVAYLRSFAAPPDKNVPGNAAAGEALYAGKGGCTGCHLNRNRANAGRALGPDLTGIGIKRSAAHLRQSLVDPAAELPADFLEVTYEQNGTRVKALRLNEDTFSVRLLTLDGQVRGFWKADLTGYQPDHGATPMPSYRGRLTEAELDDLVAYLTTLRGAK